jgi:hypothetical protein
MGESKKKIEIVYIKKETIKQELKEKRKRLKTKRKKNCSKKRYKAR